MAVEKVAIPFSDLSILRRTFAEEIEAATQRVLASGWYILGPEVEAFEAEFAAYHGVAYAVGVANGTDAIELALRAGGIGPGDEVITVAHTAVATVYAIERTGAIPVLVDIDPVTYTIDPEAVRAAVSPRTRAIVSVHLYGHPANISTLVKLADTHHLLLVEDCAQAHGARWDGGLVGTFGQMGAFSFYPTKNLGSYGDAGAVITNDPQLAERLRRLRAYGQTTRSIHVERGINSRLDELQAAFLHIKLPYLDMHNQTRRELAQLYGEMLHEVILPHTIDLAYHVYHLFVIRHPQRDMLRDELAKRGVNTLVHYPIPVHCQEAYTDLGYAPGSLPISERVAREVLSLPMYIGLTTSAVASIAERLDESLKAI